MKSADKKTVTKYVTESTFEKSMQAIAKSFSEQKDVLELMLKEIRNIHEDNKGFRQGISGLYSDGISFDRRMNNLTMRVEKLESKR